MTLTCEDAGCQCQCRWPQSLFQCESDSRWWQRVPGTKRTEASFNKQRRMQRTWRWWFILWICLNSANYDLEKEAERILSRADECCFCPLRIHQENWKFPFFRIPVDNMSCISLSLDEKKALRKVKEVFRNSQRSIPNLDRSNGRTRQPVTKVYNHDFANRTSQHSISFDIFQSYLTRWTVNVMWKVNWIQWCIEMSLSSLLPLSLLLSLLVRSCVLSTMNKFQKSQRSLSKCVS